MKIFEDIERRWNEPTQQERDELGRIGGEGMQKVFEVREMDNDASFLRNYLTRDLVEELDLYLYKLEGDRWVIAEKNWEIVRDTILAGMTNFGQPYIVVEDGDHRRSRELYLKHCHEGDDLDMAYADKTLKYVHQLWSRPVHLETLVEGKQTVLTYDGLPVRAAAARK
jgi:stage V sporulation protein R